ncbi:hypothetical protein WA171_001249, partial [Blastocystis sp. BT1]
MSSYILYSCLKSFATTVAAFYAYKSFHESLHGQISINRQNLLSYFVFLGLLTLLESTIEPFVSWLPLYYELKILLLLFVTIISYSNPSYLHTKISEPLFSSFDCHVAPHILSLSNTALYYTVAICSPFVSQQHLVSIRNYLQQASTEMENRIASNPVPSSTQPVPSPSTTTHSASSSAHSTTHSSLSPPVDTYKRMTATLP